MSLVIVFLLGILVEKPANEFVRESPEVRFQTFAQTMMGADVCPDRVPRVSRNGIDVSIETRLETRGALQRLIANVTFRNAGAVPERLEKRYLDETKERPRTDYLWIFDRLSRKWLGYRGPHGRLTADAASEYVTLAPGQLRTLRDLDITENYEFPRGKTDLVAKVMFQSFPRVNGPDIRVESKCTPVPKMVAKAR